MIHRFDRFELDTDAFELRRDGEVRPLEPQVFDLLRYFVENPNRLISRDEIFAEIWSGRIVSDTALSSRIKAVRRVLDDNGRDQRLIRTVHGRGFRFVPPARPDDGGANGGSSQTDDLDLIGRDRELGLLHETLRAALGAPGRLVFVAGESGIGKTSLVQHFLRMAAAERCNRMSVGHCVEQSGPVEPYLPLLDAIGQLCRADPDVGRMLGRFAPSWFLQFPFLVDEAAAAGLAQRAVGAGRDRMLREMLNVLPELVADAPLILVLEDMHWSDASTLAFLKTLGRRGLPKGLMVVGTYRNTTVAEDVLPADDMARELSVRGQCTQIVVGALERADVERFLVGRLERASMPEGLVERLLERSNGNPFFMSALVDWWVSRGLTLDMPGPSAHLGPQDPFGDQVPPQLLRLLGAEFERLPTEDQVILEWAAVAGQSLYPSTLAAASGLSVSAIEDRLVRLADKHRFVRPVAEAGAGGNDWPVVFDHSLKREAIYRGIPASRRRRMHLALGRARRTELSTQADDRPAELACHFLLGGEAGEAIPWLIAAAQKAARRGGHGEALDSLERAKALLSDVTDSDAGAKWEMAIEAAIASSVLETVGVVSPEAERAFLRAVALAERYGDAELLSTLLYHLGHIYELRGEFDRTQELMRKRRALKNRGESAAIVETAELMACSAFHQGKLRAAIDEADTGLSTYNPDRHMHLLAASGRNAAVSCQAWAARALCFMGMPDTALGRIEMALRVAEDEAPYTLCNAHEQAAYVRQHRGEPAETLRHAEEVVRLGLERHLPYRVATGKVLRGWAACVASRDASRLDEMVEAVEACDRLGVRLEIPYLRGLVAEACLSSGNPETAAAFLVEALDSPASGRGYYYEAELHRLQGCVLSIATSGIDADAQAAFERAFAIAEAQSARLLALRVAVSMATFVGGDVVRNRVAPLYRGFTEGFGAPDLKAAADLLKRYGLAVDA